MGPLARLDLAENLSRQLEKSLQQGAKLVVGGERDDTNFQPTLIDFVDSNNIAFQEETFGPLATIIRAKDENDAVAIANNHRYGLASSIWTEDRVNAHQLARKLEAGNVFVNSLVRSDSRIPFGGIKKIGLWKGIVRGWNQGIHEYEITDYRIILTYKSNLINDQNQIKHEKIIFNFRICPYMQLDICSRSSKKHNGSR
jgi:acyl-CoA reductase-like NAD-dependent aldehyde dehydrogenase